MRFGRRNRSKMAVGRRILQERLETESKGMAVEERDALLESTPEESESMENPQEETIVSGDPTQHLLTALGRFQRQVNKAAGGASQEEWADECMAQLISGIEIALKEQWEDVSEALTDTARILHSYEDAGRASESTGFLQDSYEILCLMVGDLIVDNVRSGVMQKWRARYQEAVSELEAQGIALVQDEIQQAPPAQEEALEPVAEAVEEIFESAAEPVQEEAVEESTETTDSPFDTVEEVSPFQEPEALESDATEEPSPFNPPNLDEVIEAVPEAAEEVEEIAPEQTEDWPSPEENLDAEAVPETEAIADEAPQEAIVEAPQEETPESLEEEAAPEEVMEDLTEATESEAPSELAETVADDSVEEAVEAVAEEPAEGDADTQKSMEDLLKQTQEAMARGDAAAAKQLALQMAVDMARLEAKQAEEQLNTSEGKLDSDKEAIAAAKAAMEQAKQQVNDTEAQVTERESEFQDHRKVLDDLRGKATAVEEAIQTLDNRIQALQGEREKECERLREAQQALEDGLAEESRLQTDLEQLSAAAATAQDTLSGAEAEVGYLETQLEEHEALLMEALQQSESKQKAVEEIQRTLGVEDAEETEKA